jgi:hypothetical protein
MPGRDGYLFAQDDGSEPPPCFREEPTLPPPTDAAHDRILAAKFENRRLAEVSARSIWGRERR